MSSESSRLRLKDPEGDNGNVARPRQATLDEVRRQRRDALERQSRVYLLVFIGVCLLTGFTASLFWLGHLENVLPDWVFYALHGFRHRFGMGNLVGVLLLLGVGAMFCLAQHNHREAILTRMDDEDHPDDSQIHPVL